MPVYKTFSQRQKERDQAGQPQLFRFDDLPPEFRHQVVHIWSDLISQEAGCWQSVYRTIEREKGLPLIRDYPLLESDFDRCEGYLLRADTEGALDIIELAFQTRLTELREMDGEVDPDDLVEDDQGWAEAIADLNRRFLQHGLGYTYTFTPGEGDGELFKVTSQYIHAEVVEPALTLLHDAGFRGATDEFLRAHEHFRHGRYKEATAEALKALESTMKTICDQRSWPYDKARATAKDLVAVLFAHNLIPPYLQDYFNGGLLKVLEAGVPTVRNKTSGHGQGSVPTDLPEHYAAYALHQAAANIVFLVTAHQALPAGAAHPSTASASST